MTTLKNLPHDCAFEKKVLQMRVILVLSVLCVYSGLAQMVPLGVASELDFPVSIYWRDTEGELHLNLKGLVRTENRWISSELGHQFVALDSETSELVGKHTVGESAQLWVLRDEGKSSQCKIHGGTEPEYEKCFDDPISIAGMGSSRARNVEIRETRNIEQVKIVPKFTQVGFKKMRCPEEVWEIASSFYEANKMNYVRENLGPDNTVVNFWNTPTYMVYLPESGEIKPEIYRGVKDVLEEWIGGETELDPTSMYGIRYYLNGSVLENHLDRLRTHAVSAIITIDQDLEEPWPLHLYDNDGNLHQLSMETGDMVLYESARAIHGRPEVMNGRYYANFFIHFAPVDKRIWPFTTDNYRTAL